MSIRSKLAVIAKTLASAAERLAPADHRTASEGADEQVQVTVSVGIAYCPTDANEETALIAAADKALYQANESGRNRVCTAG